MRIGVNGTSSCFPRTTYRTNLLLLSCRLTSFVDRRVPIAPMVVAIIDCKATVPECCGRTCVLTMVDGNRRKARWNDTSLRLCRFDTENITKVDIFRSV